MALQNASSGPQIARHAFAPVHLHPIKGSPFFALGVGKGCLDFLQFTHAYQPRFRQSRISLFTRSRSAFVTSPASLPRMA